MTHSRNEPDRLVRLPAIGQLLETPLLRDCIAVYGRDAVRVQARARVDELRQTLLGGDDSETLSEAIAALPQAIARDLDRSPARPLQPVLNATGVFLHTNLGRSPLPSGAARALEPLIEGWCDLEIDLQTLERSDRARRPSALLETLTGAEGALVVNNGAAALVLAIASTIDSAEGARNEVIVSRGELVEIGGSFRIPDMLEAAGATLVEVGTTNRTRASDYADAIGEHTALLLKIYPSNFRQVGFVSAVHPRELAALGRERGVPTLVDEGSGLLHRSDRAQLAGHPSLADLVRDGVDLACGSGDKVLGGPQAGLLVGRSRSIDRCRRHPLYRTYRAGRLVHAALEWVLRRHLRGESAPLERLWPESAAHRQRLNTMLERLRVTIPEARILSADAALGGGTAPELPVPGEAIAVPGGRSLMERLAQPGLIGHDAGPAVLATVRDGHVVIDLRTIEPADDERLLARLVQATTPRGGSPE